MPDESGHPSPSADIGALAELASCESLSQVAAWAARGLGRPAAAEAALVWTPDSAHPILVSTGSWGESIVSRGRQTLGRDDPLIRDLLRDRQARLAPPEVLAESPLALPEGRWAVLVPVVVPAETAPAPIALAMLFFETRPRREDVLDRMAPFLRHAAPALDRAIRAERKTAGMRQAIERLTSLYDVSKAFGSTIEWADLTAIVSRKAVDFANAEAGSLWLLEPDGESVSLAATAVNENYDIAEPPESVGGSLVGDVLAEAAAVRRNGLTPDAPGENGGESETDEDAGGYPVRSVLGVRLLEDDRPIGALVVVNKRGRVPEFSEEDEELLEDLSRQAVRALRNARQYEAERKVEELDALLAVSREITATLDLDKVMSAIVNATSALVTYDRCAIAVQDRGRLRLGAVSGTAELDRRSAETQRTNALLQWVFLSGEDVNVTELEDGSIAADRPETEEKFRAFFAESGFKAYYGVLLKDEEGKLGVLGFECREPIVFDAETRDLLQILVNQATVAVRNAQLYQQVPLAGFLKPLLARRQRLLDMPKRRRLAWGVGAVALVVLLFLPWRLRVGGPARIQPGRQSVVTAGVDGVVAAVFHREGDRVLAGEVIATLHDESYRAALSDAESAYRIAEGNVARSQTDGAAAPMFDAESRRQELAARIAMEEDRLAHTRLTAAVSGTVVTPHLDERIGQSLARGAEFCVVADVGRVDVEVAVPEEDAAMLARGQSASIKLNSYPSRTFRGTVERVGARVREGNREKERFVIAEVALGNGDGALKTGMVGRGKIVTGRRPLGILLVRRPARWLYSRLWPLLP